MENFDTTKEGKLKCKICKSRLKGHVGGLAKHLCLRHNKNFINSEQTNAEINLNTQVLNLQNFKYLWNVRSKELRKMSLINMREVSPTYRS